MLEDKRPLICFNTVSSEVVASILAAGCQVSGELSPRLALRRGPSVLLHVASLRWKLHRAGGEKSALARQHKRAFDWANQSGSSRLGPLPRKHSSEGVSPYPCALAERSQYYQCATFTLSPPLSSPPPPPPPSPLVRARSLCPPPSNPPHRRPTTSPDLCAPCALSVLTDSHQEAAIGGLMSYHLCYWLCSAQISSDSLPLRCLPARRRRQPLANHITIFKCVQSGGDRKSALSSLKLRSPVVYNVYCYSSADWSEDEEQMGKVVVDAEMFMT